MSWSISGLLNGRNGKANLSHESLYGQPKYPDTLNQQHHRNDRSQSLWKIMASPVTPSRASSMEGLMGLLRIRVKRGINLAIRDISTSDPYVVVKMGKQKLKTRVIHKDINPEWNEDLTLSVADPKLPIKLIVYDHDTFSKDDKMGEAEFDIRTYLEALKMDLSAFPSGTIISRIQPCRTNCLSDESSVMWYEGKVIQDMILRLRNVESGEVEIQLQWIDLPGSRGVKA